MAKIILTSRYLKPSKSGKELLVNYIATRENVERTSNKDEEVTINQKTFINNLISKNKSVKELLEYDDYMDKKTVGTATQLINVVMEQNETDILKYINYIAKRPRVEKINTHGLFSDEGVVENLYKKAKEIDEQDGIVWTHILSLRREDAERLNFNNYTAFKELLEEHREQIAKSHRIKLNNLKYVSAFHNESHHPHIHLLVYSKNPKEGYLTDKGIEKLRSKFANSIFENEMYNNFQNQNSYRDEIRNTAKINVNELLQSINKSSYENEKINLLTKEFSRKIRNKEGSKTYKWLCKKGNEELKNIIDEIVKELSKEEHIKKLYDNWYEAKENNLKIYNKSLPERIPLHKNETFYTIHNYIIKEILNSNFTINERNDEIYDEEVNENYEDNHIEKTSPNLDKNEEVAVNEFKEMERGEAKANSSHLHIKWTDEYKEAKELMYNDSHKNNLQEAYNKLLIEAKKGSILAIYDVALMVGNKTIEDSKIDSELYFKQALNGFKNLAPKNKKMQPYIEYRIGKMYSFGFGTGQDDEEAVDWFLKSSEKGNQYAKFSLGNAYFYGKGVNKDYDEEYHYYKYVSKKGNTFASYKLGEMYYKGLAVEVDIEKGNEYYRKSFNGFMNLLSRDADGSIHMKVGAMYEKGLGVDKNLKEAEHYYKKALEYNQEKAKYLLAKLYLLSEYRESNEAELVVENINKSIKYLNSLINENTDFKSYASYELGKFYMEENNLDILKAKKYLQVSHKEKNMYASYKLAKLYLSTEYSEYVSEKEIDEAIKILNKFIESESELTKYANYELGKLYLKDEYFDIEKAKNYLKTSHEEGNIYASYKLAQVYLSKENTESLDHEQLDIESSEAITLLNSIKEHKELSKYVYYTLGKIYLFGNGVEKDEKKAEQYLLKASELGNEYAEQMLKNMKSFQQKNMLMMMAKVIDSKKRQQEVNFNYQNKKVDKKLLKKLYEKKRDQGLKM